MIELLEEERERRASELQSLRYRSRDGKNTTGIDPFGTKSSTEERG